MTPLISAHARQRCAEMGISTKVAKRIAQNPSVVYRGGGQERHGRNTVVMLSDAESDYAIVFAPDHHLVVTVLPRTHEDYRRTEDGWETVDAA